MLIISYHLYGLSGIDSETPIAIKKIREECTKYKQEQFRRLGLIK